MQNNAKSDFKDGRRVETMINDLKSGKLKPDDVDPIRIGIVNGRVYTLDHRRLAAHREAGAPVNYRKATAGEVQQALESDKLSTANDGISIVIKGRK